VASSGRPILGNISNEQLGEEDPSLDDDNGKTRVNIATGHGAWTISQCLGTGIVQAELIEGRAPIADVAALGPK
jgi:glycine/D-amino acid oxidase-like deaminating enzyme